MRPSIEKLLADRAARKREAHLEGNRRRNARWKENHPERVAQLNKEKSLRFYNRNREKIKGDMRERAKKRWDNYTPEQKRDRALRANYGLSLEAFHALLEQQGNACGACGTDEPGVRGWQVDRCHTKGHVRGILCHHCNTGLGLARDDVNTLKKWIGYLEK